MPLKKTKIAIVEDEAAIVEMYSLRLEKDGYTVKHARNGVDGLHLCEVFNPDLILLDLRMPEMSGEEVLQELRKTDWGSQIRVIMLTNISRDEAPSILRFLNVDQYIVKAHYTPSQVAETVNKILA